MALNTGDFTLGVMPTAPTGVEKLGAFNVGQVLEASRLGAENVEQAFNTPFRVQQEIARTKTAKAQSDISKATAANAPALLEAHLAGQRESVKSNILANQLSSNTLAAKTKLTQTHADLSAAELALANETSPIKKQVLQANLDALRTKADTDKAEYDAALSADLFATQAGVKAWMARAGTKALTSFDGNGTRTITDATGRPLAVQTLTPTAEGAGVSSVAIPQTVVVNTVTENLKDSDGNDVIDPKTGLPMMQRYNILSSGARAPVGTPITSGVAPGIDLKSKTLIDESAPAAGLPSSAPNIAYNRDPETAKRILIAEDLSARKELTKDENALETRMTAIPKLDEFQQLNERTDTGPLLEKVPGTIMFSKDRQRMQSIANELTPSMRQGLPGAASNFDVAMFKSATVGVDKDKETNDAVIAAFKAQTARDADYLKFRQDYLNRYKTLNGANAAWKGYVEANPIFDPKSEEPKINTAIQTREQYFAAKESAAAPVAQPSVQPQAAGGVPTITSKAEFDALPAGSRFVWNGQTLIK